MIGRHASSLQASAIHTPSRGNALNATITQSPSRPAEGATPSPIPLSPPSGTNAPGRQPQRGLVDPRIAGPALREALRKLDPRQMAKNPVMLLVEIGATITTAILVLDLLGMADTVGLAIEPGQRWFVCWIAAWLWFTVIFANFAEAMAEGRGKAQAESLKKTRAETRARVLVEPASAAVEFRSSSDLHVGDIVLLEAGDIVPGDGEVIDGVAFVSEAAITGESAPVLKEAGSDIASSVTGGTQIVSDWLKVRITAEPGKTFLDRMIALVEGAQRKKTPNEIALNILLAGLTIIFLIVVISLAPIAEYARSPVSIAVLVALLVTLIPTTIGALLSAIGIAGMDRLVQHNVLAMSGRAVEAAGDVDVLLLDKTGTITYGNRMAASFLPVNGVSTDRLVRAALHASLADDTPEGKSIVALAAHHGVQEDRANWSDAEWIPFTAETRISGMKHGSSETIKGAVDAIFRVAGRADDAVSAIADRIAAQGATPLVVMDNGEILGVIELKDTVKPGMAARFAELRSMGIRTIMVTGDNPLTAKAIAAEAGVDDYVAEARPEDKIRLIREHQAEGRMVAMTGDGTNDAPALAQADVGVAMNTGTAAAREAGNMVDLDSDPAKLISIVAIGKQLLMTRGALTTFSIANDVAKYFAIIPAMFGLAYGVSEANGLDVFNVMRLSSPQSAILSAVIFNALIIIALIPLALRGVTTRATSASALLQRNLLIYGLGGIVAPFAGIKLIDIVLISLGWT